METTASAELIVAPLPTPTTPFVGRDQEVAAAVRLIDRADVRLLTLTGPGGVGKTRLAVRTAEAARPRFADGVAFVGLAPVTDQALVPAAIGQALGVLEGGMQSAPELLTAALRGRQLLLVLDNFEHLLDAGSVIAEVIAHCPALKVLVTSRVPLHLSAEQELPVPPLTLPRADQSTDLSELAANEAVALFLQRASAVTPHFALTIENGEAVAEVCRRLDGLPLAIELAAARSKVLAPEALLARLDHRLHLLTGGPRDQPDRLRSVRDTVAWSYALLRAEEQHLFRRLGIFRDGFSLEAAEAVAGRQGDRGTDGQTDASSKLEARSPKLLSPGPPVPLPPSVFDGVSSLVDKSLVAAHGTIGGEPRFGMLETVRAYALEQLTAAGEEAEIRRRHAAWYARFGEQAEPALYRGPDQIRWFARLDAETANLRDALTWLDAADPEAGLRLAAAIARFWYVQGRLSEGRNELERALAATPAAPSRTRAKALAEVSFLATYQRDLDRAATASEEALRLGRALDDPWSLAYALGMCALVTLFRGDYPEATRCSDASLALWAESDQTELDDRSLVARICRALAAMLLGDGDQAERSIAECLAHTRAAGDDFGSVIALQRAGSIAYMRGDPALAIERFADALNQRWLLGADWTTAYALDELAAAAGAYADDARTARLLSAAEHLRLKAGVSLVGPIQDRHEREIARVRAALGESDFTAAWMAGQALTKAGMLAEVAAIVEAVNRARTPEPPPAPRLAHSAGLTEREAEVLRLAAAGLTAPLIAEQLYLSPRTVHTHLAAIYRKLDVTTRGEAVRVAIERGLA